MKGARERREKKNQKYALYQIDASRSLQEENRDTIGRYRLRTSKTRIHLVYNIKHTNKITKVQIIILQT